MVASPILGQAYVARSPNAADNRMVNLYPELTPSGKTTAYLQRCPGLKLIADLGFGPIRGFWAFKDYTYVVSGFRLYSLDKTYNFKFIGNVSGTGPVSMADNGYQIFIACNGPSYIYNLNTSTLAQITDVDFPGAVTVVYLDGYFIFNEPNSQRIWSSYLLDGTQIDPLSYASAEASSDLVVSLLVQKRELWVFGTNSIEVWYNAGTSNFPLARITGAFNELGSAAAFSAAKLDNAIFWLGSDARGNGIVYQANGYSGQRVSTHSIEWQIQQYASLSDAIGFTYQQDGHSFYVLNFPTAGTTFVYDIVTSLWHERQGFKNGQFTRHRSNFAVFFNDINIVSDYENGHIYQLDPTVYQDDAYPQKWLRSWRAIPTDQNRLVRTAQHSLQLDAETGVGNNDPSSLGYDPQVMLRWSDDGGHTWSNEHWTSMGKIGATQTRAIWRRLGMTNKLRDRVYELSGTDPVKVAIMGAELIMAATNG